MAEVTVEGQELLVHLSTAEKLEAMHGDLHIPLSEIVAAQASDRPLSELHGFKLVGAGLPDGTKVGTWDAPSGKIFCAVHHDAPGLVVRLSGNAYSLLLIGTGQAQALADQLQPRTL